MTPATNTRPANLALRLAAMTYDGVLLFGIVFIVGYALLALMQWTYPLTGIRRLVLQAALFVVIGAYFAWCWSKGGQTLGMKSWRLHLIDSSGVAPGVSRSILRYVLAWHLVAPGLAFVAAFQAHAAIDLVAVVAGIALMLLPALFDPQRRLLHDRWVGTLLVREND